MSSIQRTMIRAMARIGFAKKKIAREKQKVDDRNRAIDDRRMIIRDYMDSLPVAQGVAEVDIT